MEAETRTLMEAETRTLMEALLPFLKMVLPGWVHIVGVF